MPGESLDQEDGSGDSVIGHWKNGQECVRLEMQEKEDNRKQQKGEKGWYLNFTRRIPARTARE